MRLSRPLAPLLLLWMQRSDLYSGPWVVAAVAVIVFGGLVVSQRTLDP